jgi:hypothetical protein
MSDTNAPRCYICWEHGPDATGRPPMRDCSCRGSDAGFAHISCIAKWAKQQCLEDRSSRSLDEFRKPWIECFQCKQFSQGHLKKELIEEFVKFTEDNYSDSDWRRLVAYFQKLTLELFNEELAHKCLEICNKLMNDDFDGPPIHSEDKGMLIGRTYYVIGSIEICRGISNNDGSAAKEGLKRIEIARDIVKDAGINSAVISFRSLTLYWTNTCIEKFKWGPEFGRTESVEGLFEKLKANYEASEGSFKILIGQVYANALIEAGHSTKASRLLNEVIPLSQQIHGSEHKQTMKLKELLNKVDLPERSDA